MDELTGDTRRGQRTSQIVGASIVPMILMHNVPISVRESLTILWILQGASAD
jgi:hypothetical protein